MGRFVSLLSRHGDSDAWLRDALALTLEGCGGAAGGLWLVGAGSLEVAHVLGGLGAQAEAVAHELVEQRTVARVALEQGQCVVGAPLMLDGAALGAIALFGEDRAPPDAHRLEACAQTIAALIGHTRALERSQAAGRAALRLAERRRQAQRVTAEALADNDPTRALEALVSGHAQIFGCRGGIGLVNAATGQVELTLASTPMDGDALRLGEGIIGRVARDGEALLVNDYPNWSGALGPYAASGIKSVIAAPLKRDRAVNGVIFLESLTDTHFFDDEDLEILERAASLASAVLAQMRARADSEHARLELERQNILLAATHQINIELLSDTLDLNALLRHVLEHSLALLEADIGGVYMIENGEVVLAASLGDEMVPRGALGSGVSGRVALEARALIVEDYAASPYYNPSHPGMDWRSVISVPLRGTLGRVLGALTVADSSRTGRFDGLSLERLERFAALAALALENARLLDDAQVAALRAERRGTLLDALSQITLELVAYEDPSGLLQRLTERTQALFNADAAVVYLLDEARQTFRRVAWHGESPGEHGTFGRGLSGVVMQREQGLIVADYLAWEGRDIHPGERSQWRAAMSAPLRRGAQVIGAFTVANTSQPDLYSSADLETLERFAAVSSLALEKAGLLADARAAERAAIARFEQLSALDAVSLQLLTQRQPSEVIASTLKLILPLIGATAGGYWRYFEAEGAVEITQVERARGADRTSPSGSRRRHRRPGHPHAASAARGRLPSAH